MICYSFPARLKLTSTPPNFLMILVSVDLEIGGDGTNFCVTLSAISLKIYFVK